MDTIRYYLRNESLKSMLFVALFLRIISVFLAKGFGMFDDHFLIIEAAQSWVNGADYNNWLPWNQVNPEPKGHSFFYVGIMYLVLSFFDLLGIDNPDTKMFLIRLIHAVYSLLIVSLSYKITLKLSDKKSANMVGWIITFAWFMPWLSVRNLVEIVSIPPLLASVWLLIRNDNKNFAKYFIAGFIGALAFSIRFQGSLFVGGIGLVLLFTDKFKYAFYYGIGAITSLVLIQGGIDLFVWKRPFAEFFSYVEYNLNNSGEYPNGQWFNYILLLVAFFVPPWGLMLLVGFFKTKKKWLIVFIPTLIFLAFHSYFPNKQERFIFPILPMYLMLGIMGWNALLDGKLHSSFWQKFTKGSFAFFLLINFIVLAFISTSYYHRPRVESMLYFSDKAPLKCIIIEGTNTNGLKLLPRFYSGNNNWNTRFIEITKLSQYSRIDKYDEKAEYVLFFANDNLKNRIDSIQKYIGPIKKEFVALPSSMDRLLQSMNSKHNANDTILIYSTVYTREIGDSDDEN